MLRFRRISGESGWLFMHKKSPAISYLLLPSIAYLILDRIKYYGAPYLGDEFYKPLGLNNPND